MSHLTGRTETRDGDHLEILAEISRAIASKLDIPTLYDTIYEQVGRLMDTTAFFIALRRPDSDIIDCPYMRHGGKLFSFEGVPDRRSVTDLVFQRGVPLLFHTDQDYRHFAQKNGVPFRRVANTAVVGISESLIFVPLNTGLQTIGVMSVQSLRPNHYTPFDLRTLTIIASQAAISIENARLFAREKAQMEERIELLARERDAEARAAAAELAQQITNASPLPMAALDRDELVISWNPAAEALLGWTADEVRGKLSPVVPDDSRDEAYGFFKRVLGGERLVDVEVRRRRRDGSPIDLSLSAAPLFDAQGQVQGITFTYVDITERKKAEAALRHLALHDVLTGLPNRALLHDRLQQAIRASHRSRQPFALLLMDLDRFKEINDTFGHTFGDLLLKQVGQRLRTVLREFDTVARLGGDEFAILLVDSDREGAELAGRKVHRAFEESFTVGGQRLRLETSVGGVLYPEHAGDSEALLSRADVAMYAAKEAKRGFVFFSPQLDRHSVDRLVLVGELREAIDSGQLVLHYQPKIELRDESVHKVEALVRWRHPRHGLLYPDQFISVAENTGLIGPLSAWVAAEGIRQCRAWQDAGLDLGVAINLSARNLQDPETWRMLRDALDEHHVSPDLLTIEVTESGIMSDPGGAEENVRQLRALGVHVSIDDFGTGFSSLSHLSQLPVDEIKVDRTFVAGMSGKAGDAVIVHAVIDLADSLGLRAVAEGVEDEWTLNMLRDLGCDAVQGRLFSLPMPADACERWVRELRSSPLRHVVG